MNILNTIPTEIVTGTEYKLIWTPWTLIGMIIVVVLVAAACIGIKLAVDEDELPIGLLSVLALILALLLLLGPVLQHDITTTVNQYEVTIDKTVPFSEIIDKYDFIEQRGDIYVLREKLPEGENING